MDHDQFVGHVQHRAELPSRGAAEKLIRATFETLAERLQPESAAHLAAQLPEELGRHLRGIGTFEHLTLEEFYERIASRTNDNFEKSMWRVRAVVETLYEAVSPGAMEKLRKQLPAQFQPLLTMPVPAL